MKKIITIFIFTVFVLVAYSQEQLCKENLTELFNREFSISNANRFSSSIHVKSEASEKLLNALLINNNKTKHKLKNVIIPKISSAVDLRIYEGIHSYNEQCSSFSFYTFKNKKEKFKLTQNLTENQKKGIVVYFKINGTDVVPKDKLNLILTYFKQLVA